ncbi:RNA 2',3'-cyclic phosphodiesterase [Candidatus Woesearchaeota archaeon]|nr:RNA 2',3'-cyclic phosphodiesterase [Candidatus Woesearchaeota archaeon]
MRCFIAVDLPENIKQKLGGILLDERFADAVKVSDYHLTLKFLGDINEPTLERVKKELCKIRFKPFKLKLDKIGSFPNRNFIRVIWIGVTPKRKIINLMMDVDNLLVSLFPREKRFDSHITLARIKMVKKRDEFMKIFDVRIDECFNVDKMKLIKSELTEKGAKYKTLEEYP